LWAGHKWQYPWECRLGADLDFRVIVPREGVMDEEKDINTFLLERVLPRLVDMVDMKDVDEFFK
jgi:hypothetical protein